MTAASARKARQILRDRRRANAKRTISTFVRKATDDTATVKGVTAALRKVAKDLRKAGELGRVQTRTERITATVIGPVYRYTRDQIARIAAAYKPRKPAYRTVAAQLRLAAHPHQLQCRQGQPGHARPRRPARRRRRCQRPADRPPLRPRRRRVARHP
jgi:hypothetical protein